MERPNKNAAWPSEANLKAAITKDGHITADFVDTGELTAAVIKAGVLQDKANQFSLNMTTGALTMNSGTFKGSLDAATGSFAGTLSAAKGTITDGTGTLSMSGGDLYIKNSQSGGAGVFATKEGSSYYACWGAVNSAARKSSSEYLEVPTYTIIEMAKYWQQNGRWEPL